MHKPIADAGLVGDRIRAHIARGELLDALALMRDHQIRYDPGALEFRHLTALERLDAQGHPAAAVYRGRFYAELRAEREARAVADELAQLQELERRAAPAIERARMVAPKLAPDWANRSEADREAAVRALAATWPDAPPAIDPLLARTPAEKVRILRAGQSGRDPLVAAELLASLGDRDALAEFEAANRGTIDAARAARARERAAAAELARKRDEAHRERMGPIVRLERERFRHGFESAKRTIEGEYLDRWGRVEPCEAMHRRIEKARHDHDAALERTLADRAAELYKTIEKEITE